MAGDEGRHVHDAPGADALSALRARGRRVTRQRTLIWDTLVDKPGSHLSAADIADAVRAREPELHQATIYRTLDALVAEGLVLRTALGANRSYYELASDHRHHHLVCSRCGTIVHVHDDAVATVLDQLEATTGFTFDQELNLPGQCATCFTGPSTRV
jgi:Fur family transcriptional regulator, ferric uptake regulator